MNAKPKRHYLYSFRRCPYAMRARMALLYAGIKIDIEEVDFKNKPAEMLRISPKGTVPILKTTDGQIIDESLDIMEWAIAQNDPNGWGESDNNKIKALICENDGSFKAALDRYKYPNRYPDEDCSEARNKGYAFLLKLDEKLQNQKQLCADHITMADIAIFPFIRQFANTDREWFDSLPLTHLRRWLDAHLNSDFFQMIMDKNLNALN